MKDPYNVLGVAKDADPAAIRKAFKALARKWHPDVSKEPGAEERFKEVSAAYDVLGDEQRRALYDEFGEDSVRPGFDADRARAWKQAAGRGFPGGSFSGGGFGDGGRGGVRFEDLLGAFGGGGVGPRRGADIEGAVEIGLLDAVRGSTVEVSLVRPAACATCRGEGGTGRKPCGACGGRGRRTVRQLGMNAMMSCDECGGAGSVHERECQDCGGTGRTRRSQALSVRVPAGVEDGQTLRLRGKGGEGQMGGPDGDLLLTVSVRPHALLRRRGADLEMELPVTLAEAIGGGVVEAPTPHGRIRVRVPPGSNNGQKLRVPGKGVTTRQGVGDLYLILRPMLPTVNDPPAVELARQLDGLAERDVRAGLDLG